MKALRAVDRRDWNAMRNEPHITYSEQRHDDWDASDRRIFDILQSVTSTIQKRYYEIGALISTDGTFTIDPQLDTMQTMAGPVSNLDYSIYNLHRP